MSRILMLTFFTFAVALSVSSTPATAQESAFSRQCPKCSKMSFERVGVDLNQADTPAANEISLEVGFDCNIPFLSNLPLLNHVFKATRVNGECDRFVFESDQDSCGLCDNSECVHSCPHSSDTCSSQEICKSSKDCQSSETGCPGDSICERCGNGCCKTPNQQVELTVISNRQPPILKNVPYVNRLFKNVGIATYIQPSEDSSCKPAAVTSTCPAGCCVDVACESTASCPATSIQLASHVEANSPSSPKSTVALEAAMFELMEMRVENARLEATLEAMENHIEQMEELAQIRIENAVLKAELKHMEKQNSHSASVNHGHFPATIARTPVIRVGVANPPNTQRKSQHALYVGHDANVKRSALNAPSKSRWANTVVKNGAHTMIYTDKLPSPDEIQRVTDHIHALHKKLDQQENQCSEADAKCQHKGTK